MMMMMMIEAKRWLVEEDGWMNTTESSTYSYSKSFILFSPSKSQRYFYKRRKKRGENYSGEKNWQKSANHSITNLLHSSQWLNGKAGIINTNHIP